MIDARPGVLECKMFGGISWMVNGNMACGTVGEDPMVRLERRPNGMLQSPAARSRPRTVRLYDLRGMLKLASLGSAVGQNSHRIAQGTRSITGGKFWRRSQDYLRVTSIPLKPNPALNHDRTLAFERAMNR